MDFQGGGRGKSILGWGCGGVVPAGGGSPLRWGTTEAILAVITTLVTPQGYIVVPFAGILRNFSGLISAAYGAGASVTHTVRVNDVNTSLAFTIADPATTGQDVVNSVAVAAGDRISIGMTRAAGVPASVIQELVLELAA